MTLYRSFAGRIKAIKQQKESGDPRNKPQVGLVDRKLKSAINDYQKVDRDFRHKLAAQMERQYRIVRPDASDQEVREAIEDTSNNQVFSQAVYLPSTFEIPVSRLTQSQLMQSNRRGQAQSALRAVQGRHEAIQKIERQMIELAQLFQDMEAAVVQQEPAVENIETKAEDTVTNLDQGNIQLDKAVDKARAARKKKWICLGIFGEYAPLSSTTVADLIQSLLFLFSLPSLLLLCTKQRRNKRSPDSIYFWHSTSYHPCGSTAFFIC